MIKVNRKAPKLQIDKIRGKDIEVGTLFEAKSGSKRVVYLRAYETIVDVVEPRNTYDPPTTDFLNVVILDGVLTVTERP